MQDLSEDFIQETTTPTAGGFIIVDLETKEFYKDEMGQVAILKTFQEAAELCGMYEWHNVWVCELKHNHIETDICPKCSSTTCGSICDIDYAKSFIQEIEDDCEGDPSVCQLCSIYGQCYDDGRQLKLF